MGGVKAMYGNSLVLNLLSQLADQGNGAVAGIAALEAKHQMMRHACWKMAADGAAGSMREDHPRYAAVQGHTAKINRRGELIL